MFLSSITPVFGEAFSVTYIIDQITHSPNRRALSELILNEFPINTEPDIDIIYTQVPSGVSDYNPLSNERPPNYQDVIIIQNGRDDSSPVVIDEDVSVVLKYADILNNGTVRTKKHFATATPIRENIISASTQPYDPAFAKPMFKVGVDYSLYDVNPTPFITDYSGQVTGVTQSRNYEQFWFAVAGEPQTGRTITSVSNSGSTKVFPPKQSYDPTARETF